MAKGDWFRRTSWTTDDRVDFAARLKRSRSAFHKSQYLRIQALHPQELGTHPMLHAALELLEQLITHYPEPSQLSSAHFQRAQCFSDLGEYDASIEAYRDSFRVRRQAPNCQDLAYLEFGELVMGLKRQDLYDEALGVLDEFGGDEVFPAEKFKAASIRALIAAHGGDLDTARTYARANLDAAVAAESPFRYHRKLGLVHFVDPEVLDELRVLAA